MKKIFLLAGAVMLLLASCVRDNGNYDYSMQARPEITIENRYMAMEDDGVRSNLVVDPTVVYPDMSRLRFVYTFTDPLDAQKTYTYYGDATGKLDDPMEGLANGTYSAKLTVIVSDDSAITQDENDRGMKYFYSFSAMLGGTAYTSGTAVLANDGGQARLHFISPEGMLFEDVYAQENDGAALPGSPLQIVSSTSFMGSTSVTKYYILTDNGGTTDGVVVGVNDLKKSGGFAEDVFSAGAPASLAAPGILSDAVADGKNYGGAGAYSMVGAWVMTMGNKLYAGTASGNNVKLTAAPAYDKDISFIAQDGILTGVAGGASFWGWNPSDKCMEWFQQNMGAPSAVSAYQPMSTVRLQFTPASFAGQAWDPRNVGMDMVAMLFWYGGCWLIADDGSALHTMGCSMSAAATIDLTNLTKNTFPAGFVDDNTKWAIDKESGVVFFSSGNKIYRYNPAAPGNAPELMKAELAGTVTMLRFRDYLKGPGQEFLTYPDFTTLEVGTEGHLYRLDLRGAVGNRGNISRDIAMTGAPVDLYNRVYNE